jgi:uncharacterized protein YcfL
MKKLALFIVALLLSISCSFAQSQSTSTQQNVGLEFHKQANPTKVHRSSFYLPIEVTYDEIGHTLTIVADDDIDGEVYIYDNNNNIVAYSSCMNSTFILSSIGEYTIKINGEDWYALGSFSVLY